MYRAVPGRQVWLDAGPIVVGVLGSLPLLPCRVNGGDLMLADANYEPNFVADEHWDGHAQSVSHDDTDRNRHREFHCVAKPVVL